MMKTMNFNEADRYRIQSELNAAFHQSLGRIMKIFYLWHQRLHQRQQLAAVSPRMLKDIGISCEQRDIETAKPFWRA